MSKIARTLLVGRVKNLTGREIWVYGTSGELVCLPKDKLEGSFGELPPPEAGVYYALDPAFDAEICHDSRYKPHILHVKYMGKGKNEEEIFNLLMPTEENMRAQLVSEGNGRPGEIVIYSDETTSRSYRRFSQFAHAHAL